MCREFLRLAARLNAALLFSLGIPTSAALSQARPDFLFEEFQVNRISTPKGSFDKIVEFHQSKEAREIAQAIASYYGVPAPVTEQVVRFGQAIVAGQISKVGEEENGNFRSPDGYTFCRADLVGPSKQDEIIAQTRRHQVTFLALVRRALGPNEDGLWYKVIVPEITGERTSVNARMRLTYVIADPPRVVNWTKEGKCQQHNVCPWVMDKDGDRKNLANCNPNDRRADRWLAGQW